EAHDLPVEADVAEKRGTGDLIADDVVDLEAARIGVAQQHVAGIAIEEAAQRNESPIGSNLAQWEGAQDRVIADIVNLVVAVAAAQDHVGRGAERRRRGWQCAEESMLPARIHISADDLAHVVDAQDTSEASGRGVVERSEDAASIDETMNATINVGE